MHITLLAVLSLLSSASAPLDHQRSTLRDLRKGDLLIINFNSLGCAHSFEYELTLSRTKRYRAALTRIETEYDWNGTHYEAGTSKRVALGTLPLSHEDVAGLDSLFGYYRSLRDRGLCTTADHIVITRRSAEGVVVCREEYGDATCAADEMSGMLSLRSVIARVSKECGE